MAKGKKKRHFLRRAKRGLGGLIPSPTEIMYPVAGGMGYNLASAAASKFLGVGGYIDMIVGGFGAWFVGKKLIGSASFADGALGALGNDLANQLGLRSMLGLGDYFADYLRDPAPSQTVQFRMPDGSRELAHVGDLGRHSHVADPDLD